MLSLHIISQWLQALAIQVNPEFLSMVGKLDATSLHWLPDSPVRHSYASSVALPGISQGVPSWLVFLFLLHPMTFSDSRESRQQRACAGRLLIGHLDW